MDLLSEKHPNFSAFSYVLNNPLYYIDPTGMESEALRPGLSGLALTERQVSQNEMETLRIVYWAKNQTSNSNTKSHTVYVVSAPGVNQELVNQAVDIAQDVTDNSGLSIRFEKIKAKKFSRKRYNVLDAAIFVGGTRRKTAESIFSNVDSDYMSERYQYDLNIYKKTEIPVGDWPEVSDAHGGGSLEFGWGYISATTTQPGFDSNFRKSMTSGDVLALTMIHGLGHVCGLGHGMHDYGFMLPGGSNLNPSNQLSTYMYLQDGDLLKAVQNTFKSYPIIFSAFTERFGKK